MKHRRSGRPRGADGAAFVAVLRDEIATSVAAVRRLGAEDVRVLARITRLSAGALVRGRKLVLFGNGGSAAHAQHIATELVGRLGTPKKPFAALAITTDTSALTAFGNDFGFVHVFERQVLALVQPGDVVVGLSASGRSRDVLRGLRAARGRRAITVGFTGARRGPLDGLCDVCFHAPSSSTQRVQELHLVVWHAICAALDRAVIERGGG